MNKPTTILQRKTSKSIFILPIFISLALFFYAGKQGDFSRILILFFISVSIIVPSFLGYYGKKIMLTNKKIYIYNRKKKIISWHILDDFKMVSYQQSKLGKIFSYGTLNLVNQKNDMYDYHFLQDVGEVYNKLIEIYEKNMKKIDPMFESNYKVEEEKIDKLG